MAIRTACPACRARLRFPDDLAGGLGQCPRCSRTLEIPHPPAVFMPAAEPISRCPFCAEEILPAARKCPHCGEWLDQRMRRGAKPSADARAVSRGILLADEKRAERKVLEVCVVIIALGIGCGIGWLAENFWAGLFGFVVSAVALYGPIVLRSGRE